MSRIRDITRGKMSLKDHADIEHYARTMQKPTASKIARKINRHPATVNWYMLTHGLKTARPRHASRPYTRGGVAITPYSQEQDELLEQLRIEGKPYREIADALNAKFGTRRTAHSVQVRNVQLAAAPDEEEEACASIT